MHQKVLFYVIKHISLHCESQTCYLLNDNTGIDLHSDIQKIGLVTKKSLGNKKKKKAHFEMR
jgi:hypothetical protein